jgi:hypothetical protein
MAAKLSANKNPVYITTPPDTVVFEPVEIVWDTDGNFPGEVYLAINGGGAMRVGGGTRTDKLTMNVSLGNSYLFMLRRVNTTPNLATLTVTVVDLEQALIDSSIGSLALEHAINPPQSILGLRVEPSVDMVRVSFTTVQATIPTVRVETLDGEAVGVVVPFLEGEKTKHAVLIGRNDPLPQDTKLRLIVTVPGKPHPLTGKPTRGVVRTVKFRTWARSIWVSFDRLQVRADGDGGNKGDLAFTFSATPVPNGPSYEANQFEEDIPATDPRANVWRALNRSITVPGSQRDVNVSVAGTDDDSGFYPGAAGFYLPPLPGRVVGSFHKGEFHQATTFVGEDKYIGDIQPGGPTSIPFRLNTGDYDVAFTVEGQIHALLRAGEGYAEAPRQMALTVPVKAGVARAGGKSAMAAGKEPGTGAKIRIGDDGTVWMKRYQIGRDPSQPVRWEQAASAAPGPVTLTLGPVEEPLLLTVDQNGEPRLWRSQGQTGEWTGLGGRLFGAVVAVTGRDGGITLFGLDAEGQLLQRTLNSREPGTSTWQAIGGGMTGDIVALPQEAGIALFAIGREGRIVHTLLRPGEDRPKWLPLGGPHAEWFNAVALAGEPGGLLLSALTAERVLHYCHWRKFPDDKPNHLWREQGPIDEAVRQRPNLPEGGSGEQPVPVPSTDR